MSADNMLVVRHKKSKWIVYQVNASTGYEFEEKSFKTRDEAIDWANDNLEFVEYGIAYIDKLEQPKKGKELEK